MNIIFKNGKVVFAFPTNSPSPHTPSRQLTRRYHHAFCVTNKFSKPVGSGKSLRATAAAAFLETFLPPELALGGGVGATFGKTNMPPTGAVDDDAADEDGAVNIPPAGAVDDDDSPAIIFLLPLKMVYDFLAL